MKRFRSVCFDVLIGFLILVGVLFSYVALQEQPTTEEIPAVAETADNTDERTILVLRDEAVSNSSELDDFANKFETAINNLLEKNPLIYGDINVQITVTNKMVFVSFQDNKPATSAVFWVRIKNLQTPEIRKRFAEKAAQKFFDYLIKNPKKPEDPNAIEIYRKPGAIIT